MADKDRLLTKEEMEEALWQSHLHLVNSYDAAAKAQDAKTAPIIREETAREIFKEIEESEYSWPIEDVIKTLRKKYIKEKGDRK